MFIDHSVYPDVDPLPDDLVTLEERADYVHRICATWDFGIVPDPETFDLLVEWRPIFDSYPLAHSPAYHAFRAWFGWPPADRGEILDTHAERLDRREGRGLDPCRQMI